MSTVDRCVRVGLLCVLGTIIGPLATCGNFIPLGSRRAVHGMAYTVPKFPGGTSLRMAMVHDVLDERYLVHGEAWNREQSRVARGVIAAWGDSGGTPPEKVLEAMDDLAVAEIHLHEEVEAAAVMRRKLALLSARIEATAAAVQTPGEGDVPAEEAAYERLVDAPPLAPAEYQRYTAEANLGTAMIHYAFAGAMRGDAGLRGMLAEGAEHIEEAVRINPRAHFGREQWQALAVRHFLAAAQDPRWLTRFTVAGESLEEEPANGSPAERYPMIPDVPDSVISADKRFGWRQGIARVFVDPEWGSRTGCAFAEVAFDEPVLAIIGMWTLGGGPNAHFALALGRLMEEVGQREIAWEGYERAVELAGEDGTGFSGDAAVGKFLVGYCRQRQAAIARKESSDPSAWEAEMRRRHQGELAWGQAYQREYQAYEAGEIAAGRARAGVVDYAAFFQGRPAIASAAGLADDLVVTYTAPQRWGDVVPGVLVGIGVCLWADVWDQRRRARKGRVGKTDCVPRRGMSRI
ncbi:MAG TPA: hypothetical protein VH253_20540 [Phycisphaerae bacterium]|nr:hypothetical protein [Phycisphaerae bacterium]